jgi:CheY-like chemotaxis protein/HPt (histidine-containing phosphotransfer) domain-containing protein
MRAFGGNLSGHRILVAEDNEVNRMYVERLLSRSGHLVANAVDGREVLAMLDADSYDLIMMDCQMPRLDGYETTREIRRREAAAGRAHIPIVAMTAAATEEVRRKCLDAGMDDYLTKPLGDDHLQEVLARWFPLARDSVALDPVRVAELRSLFPGEETDGVLMRLADEVAAQLEQLASSTGSDGGAAIAAAAHHVKGSAQLIGAVELVDAALALEQCARDGRPAEPAVTRALEAVQACWADTLRAIAAELRGDPERLAGYHPRGD